MRGGIAFPLTENVFVHFYNHLNFILETCISVLREFGGFPPHEPLQLSSCGCLAARHTRPNGLCRGLSRSSWLHPVPPFVPQPLRPQWECHTDCLVFEARAGLVSGTHAERGANVPEAGRASVCSTVWVAGGVRRWGGVVHLKPGGCSRGRRLGALSVLWCSQGRALGGGSRSSYRPQWAEVPLVSVSRWRPSPSVQTCGLGCPGPLLRAFHYIPLPQP